MRTLPYLLLMAALATIVCTLRLYDRVELVRKEGSFEYIANLLFGSPAKVQGLVFDTGSSLTILPCAQCENCLTEGAEPFYNKDQSFTGSKVRCSSRYSVCSDKCQAKKQYCEFQMRYLDGSQVLGSITSDEIRLNMPQDNQDDFFVGQFGCISTENHEVQFIDKGILGISQEPINNMFYRWFEQDPQRKLQFSFCLMKDGGYFELGHNPADDSLQPEHVLRINTKAFYKLRDLEDLKIGATSLLNQNVYTNNGMVVDTGSSTTIFPPAEFQTLSLQLANRCESMPKLCSLFQQSQNFENCYIIRLRSKQILEDDLNKLFPTIDFVFKNQVLKWKASEYLQDSGLTNEGRLLCLTVRSFGSDDYLLGVNWMVNKKITINMQEETLTIYAAQNCTYLPLAPADIGLWATLVRQFRAIDVEYLLIAGIVLFLVVLIFRENIHRTLMKLRGAVVRTAGSKKRRRRLQEETKQEVFEPSSDMKRKDNIELSEAAPEVNVRQTQQSQWSQAPK